MTYFNWLWWYKLEDTRENFIDYLINEKDWTDEEAKEYAKTFY